LRRFTWFRRKQELQVHHREENCDFAVIDSFWDWLIGTSISALLVRHPGQC
jgi:sterol desaturase/sphingolipid hydroxylase (fatty acid hydroxylase superfamily)